MWVEDLSGDAWEEHCGVLLRFRYDPADVQSVPARKGDLGLDYWIRGASKIYQCYGTEHGDTASERLRLQKNKLGDEVRKLEKNADRILDLISPMLCRRYIFLVPRYDDKQLLEYASKQSLRIRRNELAFCTDDFEITVQDLQDFENERALIARSAMPKPRLRSASPDGTAVHRWLSDNGDLATNIREKVKAVRPEIEEDRLEEWVQSLVGKYLLREDALSTLQENFAHLHENVLRLISARRSRLEALGGASSEVRGTQVQTELDDLVTRLEAPEIGLEQSDAIRLASGTVAHWLADCTLDPR